MLSTARLNRALLARQLLLRRRRITVLDAVEHLVGIQSQAPRAAYVGLWTRVAGFRPEALERLMLDRSVVRVALMRSTIHLVSARDCLALRGLVRPAVVRTSRHSAARRAAGVADADLERAGRALVDAEPRSMRELGSLLRERWPACDADALAMGVRELVPLVQVPPRGLWHRGGVPTVAAAETWLKGVAQDELSMAGLVRRYLAAYGPATVLDAQAFTGLTGLRDVFEQLRPELATFRDESGGELFDLPDAPRPAARTRPPARFLPEFDNILLSHARSRADPAGGHDVAARARKWPATRVPGRRLRGGHLAAQGDRPLDNARGGALRAAFGGRAPPARGRGTAPAGVRGSRL